jgi:hypothetical protein
VETAPTNARRDDRKYEPVLWTGQLQNWIVNCLHNISSEVNKDGVHEETASVKMEHAHSKSRIGVDFGQLGVDVNSLTCV